MFKSNNSQNSSLTTTSDSEQHFYNFISVTSLVRNEVNRLLTQLSVPEDLLSQDKINQIIEKCLKEKIIMQKTSKLIQTSTATMTSVITEEIVSLNTPESSAESARESTPQSAYGSTPKNVPQSAAESSVPESCPESVPNNTPESVPESASRSISEVQRGLDIIVEEIGDYSEHHDLIVENFQLLEHRLTNLEDRISNILLKIPNIRHQQAQQFKINTNTIKREVLKEIRERKAVNKIAQAKQIATQAATQAATEAATQAAIKATDKEQKADNDEKENEEEERLAIVEERRHAREKLDRLYYEQQQNEMNKLRYKKSEGTMKLNERVHFNALAKPVNWKFYLRPETDTKPRFIFNGSI